MAILTRDTTGCKATAGAVVGVGAGQAVAVGVGVGLGVTPGARVAVAVGALVGVGVASGAVVAVGAGALVAVGIVTTLDASSPQAKTNNITPTRALSKMGFNQRFSRILPFVMVRLLSILDSLSTRA